MLILSHRGYWLNKCEQNTVAAFKRSFIHGFGVETDIRDYKGELVISHDIADEDCISLSEFFSIYDEYGGDLPLALNIKSDGLQVKLKALIEEYGVKNYFVFDMSIPDTLLYIKLEMNVLARRSEYEQKLDMSENVYGIWLDQFHSNWYSIDLLENILREQKVLCIVSPELHGRDKGDCWLLLDNELLPSERVMLCTDHPMQAKEFFNEK